MAESEPDLFFGDKNHKLSLGGSFKSNSSTAFHTVRYDFKPASVDQQQVGELDVGSANDVTVSLPHVHGSKTSCTVYKGSKRPAQKECILIFDRESGDFTLERISSQIQVKKTRDTGNLSFQAQGYSSNSAPDRLKNSSLKKQPLPNVTKGNYDRKVDKEKYDDHVSCDNSDIVQSLKSAAANLDAIKAVKNTDGSNSSSSGSTSSSSDNDSSSDENEVQMPPTTLKNRPNLLNFDTQLHADLELSDSGSDSD